MSGTRSRSDGTGSGSGSGYSDLSALENDTDTLGRAILRHERDARRIQAVLHGSSRPFSRALPRPSLSQRLQRSNPQDKASGGEIDRRPLAERSSLEPSLNTTRTWGRRQRSERHWTHHGGEIQGGMSNKYGRRRSSTDKEEEEDAIVPHKTAFTGDHYLPRSERFAAALTEDTPPSMKRSRPPSEPSSMRHMNSSVLGDEDSRRYRDEASPIRQPARSTLASTAPTSQYRPANSANLRPTARPSDVYNQSYNHLSETEDKENLHAPIQNAETKLSRPRTFQSREVHDSDLHSNAHIRSDSIQLLERLAKVSSASPSPAKPLSLSTPLQKDQGNARSSDNQFQIPQVEEVLATPVVTGGWIETPKQDTRDVQARGTDTRYHARDAGLRETTLSTQSTTAREQDASKKPPVQHTPADPPQLTSQQQVSKLAVSKPSQSTTGDDRVRPSLNKQLTQTTSRNKQEAPVVKREHDITGSSSQQPNPSSATARVPDIRLSTQAERAPKRVTFDLNRRTVCEHCGGGYANVWEALWIELRSNFYVRDPASFGSIHLTWLGAAVVAWLCWYLLENLLCNWYCKPSFALNMDDYGANISAPKYPLVIPTLLLRPFGSAWRPFASWLTWLSGVTFHWIFGEGARDYTMPAQLSQRTYVPNKLEAGAVRATTSLRPSRWAGSASAMAVTSSRRAIASVIDAIDELGRAWDGEAYG